jgi:hypothetical protein
MRTTICAVVQLAALLGLAAVAGADEDPTGVALKGVVEDNLRAYNAKDAAAAMRSVHTKSPQYESTNAALTQQFREMDIKARLIDFKYMGHDDEFAVARVKIKVEGAAGSPFVSNTTDNIFLFHQEGGIWKVWTDDVLGVDFVQQVGTMAPPS